MEEGCDLDAAKKRYAMMIQIILFHKSNYLLQGNEAC